MTLSKSWKIGIVAALGLVLAYFIVDYSQRRKASTCSSFLAGDTHRGGQLFYSRGCNGCHSLFGKGAASAPDLGRLQPGGWRPVGMVAAMWSHGPGMWRKFKQARMGFPQMPERDVRDLFAFIGSLQYMDEAGDPSKGRDLFVEKRCAACHAMEGSEQKTGPDLRQLDIETPILWTQRMWNHSETMSDLVSKKGIPWPTFEGREMVDLLAYVRSISQGTRREWKLLPANPEKGARLFTVKGCVTCHSINGRGGKLGPDLGPRHARPPSMIQFAGLMWNHAPQMWEKIKARGLARPKFQEQEMADLIAYLYQVRYFEPQGNADLGKQIFETKGCTTCHGPEARGGKGGPNLLGTTYCAAQMAYAFWNHGPKMYQKMQAAAVPWPIFDEQEMVNLMAFLNRG
jgi:cytochrome c2